MQPAKVIGAVSKYPDLAGLAHEPYQVRGILCSEMAAAIALCREAGVELVTESGRARGHSTALLSKYLPNVEIHSFELARDDDALFAERTLAGATNVTLHYGDAQEDLPSFLRMRNARTAVLIDGPKGGRAVRLLKDCVVASEGVVLGFIHDLNNPVGGAGVHRTTAERFFERAFFTDSAEYVSATEHLDRNAFSTPDSGWSAPYTMASGPSGSYGPTLGCFEITDRDRAAAGAEGRWRRLRYRARRRMRLLLSRH